MLIVEQSTLQDWWHNHHWGFRLLVSCCSWTQIKDPHIGVNWPRRVSQELQELHPGWRRSHSVGLHLSPPSHFKKMPEQQNVLKLFGREQATMANMADVPLKHVTPLFYQHIWKWSASPMATWPNTKQGCGFRISFPILLTIYSILCISLNEGIGNKVNMLRNDGVAQDDSLYLSPLSLWFEHGPRPIFSFPFPFVGRIPSKRVTRISTAECIDINNDAIHYRNTGVR